MLTIPVVDWSDFLETAGPSDRRLSRSLSPSGGLGVDMSTYRELGNQNQVQLRIRDWLVSIGFVLNCLACLFALVAGESQVSGCGTYRLLIRCIIVEHCRRRPVLLR